MKRMFIASAIALGLAGQATAEESDLALGGGESIVYSDSGFVSVEYMATAFGMTIHPEVVIRAEGAEPVTRPATDADYARACAAVMATGDASLGGHPPKYVFFQVVTRRADLGLVSLDRTRDIFFEIRRGTCRRMRRAPEETK